MKAFINPGHAPNGFPDPGACGCGLRESDVAANVGKLVCHYLNAAGVETELLQSDSLEEISGNANASGADIFISIHCNSHETPWPHGTETCIFDFGGEREMLAKAIQAQIVNTFHTVDRGLKPRQNLHVLKRTNMPACLVEMAFISNPDDAALLRDHQDDFARAIARGVTDFEYIARS